MKKIFLFALLIITISVTVYPQVMVLKRGWQNFFIYTPITGTATVSGDMVEIFGSETRVKTTYMDTLATRISPQRWMVISGVDSTQGLSKIVYNLPEDSTFTYYHSILQFTTYADTIYKKGVDSTFTTLLLPPTLAEVLGGPNVITISWANPTEKTWGKTYIERSSDGINYSLLDSVSLTTLSYRDEGLASSTVRWYRIRNKATHYSAYAYAGSGMTDEQSFIMSYNPSNLNWGTLDSAATYTVTDSIVNSIDTSWTCIDSSVAHIDTIAGETFSPDLLGTMTGGSVDDFPVRVFEANNTFSIINGQYCITYNPQYNYREDARADKQFPAQSDSIFAGARITMSSNLKSYMGSDELMLLSIVDTVKARLLVSVCAIDGADTDSLYDSWQIKYWNGLSNTSITVPDSFALGKQLSVQIVAHIDTLVGYWTVKINGANIKTVTGLSNNSTYGVLLIGNYAGYNSSDVAITGSVSYDDIYVNSSSVANNWWDGTPPTYDTTWVCSDSTSIVDTTWSPNNYTVYADSIINIIGTNIGTEPIDILSISPLEEPFATMTQNVLLYPNDNIIIPVRFRYSYKQGSYSGSIVIAKDFGDNDTILTTGTITSPVLNAPINITVTHNVDTTGFVLNWDSYDDSTRIYMSSDNINFFWVASVGNVKTYTISGFSPGETKWFYLKSLRGTTLSSASNTVYYMLPIQSPLNPLTVESAGNIFAGLTSSGLANGTSWDNKFSYTNINWAAVSPGDTIFIDGGYNGLTYTGNFSIGKSGTKTAYIVIMPGYSLGHNGGVTFRTATPRYPNFNFVSYVEFNGFTINSELITSSDRVMQIYGGTGVRIKNCTFPMLYNYCGIYATNSPKLLEIIGCSFTQDSLAAQQTDCIFVRGTDAAHPADSIFIIGNTFVCRNNNLTPHSDGFQMYLVKNIWFERNKCYVANDKISYTQVFYGEQIGGRVTMANNLFYIASPAWTPMAYINRDEAVASTKDTVVIYNNTFVYNGYPSLSARCPYIILYGTSIAGGHFIAKNNLFSDIRGNLGAMTVAGFTTYDIDYNIYYAPASGSYALSFEGTARTLSEMRSMGYDLHSYIGQPIFVNYDYSLNKWDKIFLTYNFNLNLNSIGENIGYPILNNVVEDLGGKFNQNINGVVRTGWNIGAF